MRATSDTECKGRANRRAGKRSGMAMTVAENAIRGQAEPGVPAGRKPARGRRPRGGWSTLAIERRLPCSPFRTGRSVASALPPTGRDAG